MNDAIFVDADVVLDLLCKREPFYESAAQLFTLGDRRELYLATTSLVYANVFYILRKILGTDKAKGLLQKLRLIVHVVPVNEKMVYKDQWFVASRHLTSYINIVHIPQAYAGARLRFPDRGESVRCPDRRQSAVLA